MRQALASHSSLTTPISSLIRGELQRNDLHQYKIVAVHKRMRVLIAQEPLELGRIATERLRNLLGVEAGQTTGQMRAGFVIDPYRIAGGKIAMHIESAGGQQRCPTTANGLGCTRINTYARVVAAKPIHRRREDPRALTGANTVPTGSPIIAGPAFEAHVSTVGIPETAATRAASSFVTMPPVPTLDPEPDTWISPSASITLGTYSTRRDPAEQAARCTAHPRR